MSYSPHPYKPVGTPAPGPAPYYAENPYAPPQPGQYGYGHGQGYEQSYNGDTKSPYEGERFKPKKRINDPIFLILFIAQVRHASSLVLTDALRLVGRSSWLDLLSSQSLQCRSLEMLGASEEVSERTRQERVSP